MCSNPDSKPPIEPLPGSTVVGRHLHLTTPDGNELTAFGADASDPSGRAIIVLPDYYGLTPFYEDLTLRFAELGVDAIAIDYYSRTASPPPRDASFEHELHAARSTWSGLQADVVAAAQALRSTRPVTSLFSVGFCFGGRASFLLGTVAELAMTGVIGFYGWPVGSFANDTPAPADVTDQLYAPVLGIFGAADPKISSEDVETFEVALADAPAPHRLISYAGAPHSFFDRKHADHAGAAAEAWSEVRAFIDATSS